VGGGVLSSRASDRALADRRLCRTASSPSRASVLVSTQYSNAGNMQHATCTTHYCVANERGELERSRQQAHRAAEAARPSCRRWERSAIRGAKTRTPGAFKSNQYAPRPLAPLIAQLASAARRRFRRGPRPKAQAEAKALAMEPGVVGVAEGVGPLYLSFIRSVPLSEEKADCCRCDFSRWSCVYCRHRCRSPRAQLKFDLAARIAAICAQLGRRVGRHDWH
jgi:hypothetical protein